jgi:hypothetical protein
MDAEQANKKVRYILGLDKDKDKLTPRQAHLLDTYGLGTERSLDDYFTYAGIDVEKKQVLKNMCEMSTQDIRSHAPAVMPPGSRSSSHTTLYIVLIVVFLVVFIAGLLYYLHHHHTTRKKHSFPH